jgi:hypothetical protein
MINQKAVARCPRSFAAFCQADFMPAIGMNMS